ncbi:DNA damage-regulated autophagy modulator protein 1-like isoform X2 [Convolutriloba macropyga]|uniref:DNA damage-regulated autophagy modulator protein 1-like isoform X2 n=1 Tax=Convolutriloba macropyga TaxID=536237 RepID=UPI003F5262E2
MPGEQKTERIIDRIGLSWLPMLSFQSAIVLLTTFYLIALSHNQLEAKLAFISDTGAQPPASCWFSLLMNFTAFCFVAVVIARFIEIKFHLTHTKEKVLTVNVLSCAFGVVGSLGMWIVAAFQEMNAALVHRTVFNHSYLGNHSLDQGAGLMFISAVLYTCLQCYITHQLIKAKVFNYKWMLVLRIIIAVVFTVTFMTFGLSSQAGDRYPPDSKANATVYYLSTGTEYVATISLFLFVLSFAYEFSFVKINFDVSTPSLARVTNAK